MNLRTNPTAQRLRHMAQAQGRLGPVGNGVHQENAGEITHQAHSIASSPDVQTSSPGNWKEEETATPATRSLPPGCNSPIPYF